MMLVKLAIVFAVVVLILYLKKPLYAAMGAGIVAAWLLYGISVKEGLAQVVNGVFSMSTYNVLLSYYFITYLMFMMDKRDMLNRAEKSLNSLISNRRVSLILAMAFVGLLPSAAAVYICGGILTAACGDSIDNEEKTFIATFFRHVPESFMPIFTAILLALAMTGTSAGSFVIVMIPMVLWVVFVGYFFHIRKIPSFTPIGEKMSKKKAGLQLVNSLWAVAAVVIMIVAFDISVYAAAFLVILAMAVIYRYSFKEIIEVAKKALQWKVIANSVIIMVFKAFLDYTGVVETIPDAIAQLPIPMFLSFALIFFVGTIISGSQAIIAMCMPMVMSAMPEVGLPMMMLVMTSAYAGMQFSPTHVCLAMVTDYFNTTMGALMKKTAPMIALVLAGMIVYYLILTAIL